MIDAIYFDGRSAKPRPVRISLSAQALVIADDSGVISRQATEQIRVQEPLKNAPQRIDLGAGAVLEVADKVALQALLADANIGVSPVVSAQRSWSIVAACLVGVVVLAWAGYRWLLPWGAERAVTLIPANLERKIGEQAWPQMDREMFVASKLSAQRQQAIRDQLQTLAAAQPSAPAWQLEFRSSKEGPNAFAMPGGRIVITDELIAKATSDDAVIGVLAHELGHVAQRHSLRLIVQSLAVSAVISLWLGDVSSIIVAIPSTLASLRYSRDFEFDADAFAIKAMRAVGSSTVPMADLLVALDDNRDSKDVKDGKEGKDGKDGSDSSSRSEQRGRGSSLWSTHPITSERIKRLRAGSVAPAQ